MVREGYSVHVGVKAGVAQGESGKTENLMSHGTIALVRSPANNSRQFVLFGALVHYQMYRWVVSQCFRESPERGRILTY